MKTIAIINQKGGTGKTTTTVNLGVALAQLGKKVVLLDLDSQGNLSYSFGVPTEKGTIGDVLQSEQPLQAILVEREGVQVAPSSAALADVEISLVNKIGRERYLRDRVKEIKDFDFCFIDCPPSLSILTINALNAADEVLIPVQMEVLSLEGLSLLLETANEVRSVLNTNLKICGIVPIMYDRRRNLSREVLEQLKKVLNDSVYIFSSKIRECVKIAEAPSFAQSVLKYAPGSSGADDFLKLAKEFLRKEK